jgi:transcriptional regulator with XRE-family HTH domain
MSLRNLRRARTLNQEDLARLAGISQQSLSKIEKGILVPSTDVQALLATILGVSPKDLWPRRTPKASRPPVARLAS